MKRVVALVTLAAFVVAGCGKKKSAPGTGSGSAGAAAAGGAGAAGTGSAADLDFAPVPADPAQAAVATAMSAAAGMFAPAGSDRVGKVIDAMTAAAAATPRDSWDPAAVVASAGRDRLALFTWVRDKTALVPYRGSLRGPVGVMMDRVGNSLDRALLLADLLKQAGMAVRLVNATLPPDAVAKLAASWAARARPAIPAGTFDGKGLLDSLVRELGVDAAAFAKRFAEAETAAEALATRTRARIAEQTAALTALVPAADPPPVPDPAAFEDHWWVQVEDGGVWQDFDPTLPDAEPGQALAAVGETVAPDALADERHHTLTLRVIGEIWHDQTREETTLLEHTFAPSRFWGQRISLTNIPIDVPDEGALFASKDPAAEMRTALAAQTEWIPVLRIGTGVVVKMSVTDAGELYDVSAPDANTTRLARAVQRATKKAVGGATDLLGTLPDQPGADPAAPPPVVDLSGFTAEWIEFELRAPGGPPRIVRRQVFDNLGGSGDRSARRPVLLAPPARVDRALALAGETEILPVFARIPEAFVADRTVKALTEARPVLSEVVALAGKPAPADLRQRIGQLPPLPGALYRLAQARLDWSGVGDKIYLDQLTVLTERQRLVTSGAGITTRESFDIIANSVTAWPAPGVDARAIRIAQGVADTAAESAVLACDPQTSCTRGANTSELFATSGGKGWSVISSPDASGSLPGAAEARRLAGADLANGYVVVAAPGSAPVWWRVDPRTGETLGMTIRGGSTSTETAVLDNMILFGFQAGKCIYQHARSSSADREMTGTLCVLGALLGFIGGSGISMMGGSRGLALGVQILGTLIG